MLEKDGMTGCKPIGTPLDVNLQLRLGPDIAYAVSALSQFMEEAIASSTGWERKRWSNFLAGYPDRVYVQEGISSRGKEKEK